MAVVLTDNILQSVKEYLSIVPEYDAYDPIIINLINSVFSTLHQLGYTPCDDYELKTGEETWDEIIHEKKFNFVKTYISMKVKLLFDPPSSSFAVDRMNNEINQYEWRINVEVESGGIS